MKKIIVKCNTTEEEILQSATAYYESLGYETQQCVTENGETCMQARKTSWVRNATGTSYAIRLVVRRTKDNSYELSAGWGKWADKVIVGGIAVFIAFGVLVIPTCVGIINQIRLPKQCLDYVSQALKLAHPECRIYQVV